MCGIDGSSEAAEAVRQAALLAAPRRPYRARRRDPRRPRRIGRLGDARADRRARAAPPQARLGGARPRGARRPERGIEVTTTLRTGPAAALLAVEAARLEAELIAVGSHGQGRLAGRLLGSVATRRRPRRRLLGPDRTTRAEPRRSRARSSSASTSQSRRCGRSPSPASSAGAPAHRSIRCTCSTARRPRRWSSAPRRTTSWSSARAACADCARWEASARRSPTGRRLRADRPLGPETTGATHLEVPGPMGFDGVRPLRAGSRRRACGPARRGPRPRAAAPARG